MSPFWRSIFWSPWLICSVHQRCHWWLLRGHLPSLFVLLSSPLITEGRWFLKALPAYWYPLSRVSFLSLPLILGMQAFSNYHLRPDLSARRHLELQLSARLCSSISNSSPRTGLCYCSAVPGCSKQIRITWSSGVEDTRGMAFFLPRYQLSSAVSTALAPSETTYYTGTPFFPSTLCTRSPSFSESTTR